MSSISGPGGNSGHYTQSTQENDPQTGAEQHVQADTTAETAGSSREQETARTTHDQAYARFAASERFMGPDAPPADEPPSFASREGTQIAYNPTMREHAPTTREQVLAMREYLAGQQQQVPQLPAYGEHESTPSRNPANDPALRPRPSTSRLRQAFSQQSSTSSFQTSANASRVSMPGRQGSADVPPPVPPLPASLRGTTAPSQLNLREGGESSNQPGSSTGPGTIEGSRAGRFGNLFSRDKQGSRNHNLRQALERGDHNEIQTRLYKTNPPPNPATPSSKQGQNAFHKVGLGKPTPNRDMIDKLFDLTPVGQRASAARMKDTQGNTPLHYVEQRLGTLEGTTPPNSNERRHIQNETRRLEHLSNRLREASARVEGSNGNHPLQEITNNQNQTPEQMRASAREAAQVSARTTQGLREAGLL
jgi:hypothetical protein